MSKQSEILHKLSIEDRSYLNAKFKLKDHKIMALECDNKLYKMMTEEEAGKNKKLKKRIKELEEQLRITEKALELAVADKIKYENLMVEGIVGKGAVVAVPKKEQWYLEQAKEMMKSE